MILKNLIPFFKVEAFVSSQIFDDLDKFNKLKSQKEKKKCKTQLQNYMMICEESILMNTMSYQMLKEKNRVQI